LLEEDKLPTRPAPAPGRMDMEGTQQNTQIYYRAQDFISATYGTWLSSFLSLVCYFSQVLQRQCWFPSWWQLKKRRTMLQVLYFSSLPFLNATVLFHTPHHIPFHLSSV
jgi:hypothetical protein